MVLYYYVLGASPTAILGITLFLSVMVFVPIHYVYPSRTRFMQGTTIGLGAIWTVMMFAISMQPRAEWAPMVATLSLFYPAYYAVISGIHHTRVHQRTPAA
jgi:phosphatidylcholine synthase